MSDSLQPYGQEPPRLLSPWDFPGKITKVGCQVPLQGIFLPQESNQHLLNLLHWKVGSLPLAPPGKPFFGGTCPNSVKHTTFLCKYSLGSLVPKVAWVSFGDCEAGTCPQEESSQPLAFLIPGRFYRGRTSPHKHQQPLPWPSALVWARATLLSARLMLLKHSGRSLSASK